MINMYIISNFQNCKNVILQDNFVDMDNFVDNFVKKYMDNLMYNLVSGTVFEAISWTIL